MAEPASPRPSTAMTSPCPSPVTMRGAGRRSTRAFSGTNHDPGAGGSGACGSAGPRPRHASSRPPGRRAPWPRRLPEVLADELALLGQQMVEMLVDVRLADRLRGQVQVLDLLELAGASVRHVLIPSASGPRRHPAPDRAGRRPASAALRHARRGGRCPADRRMTPAARTVPAPPRPRVPGHRARRPPRAGRTSRRRRSGPVPAGRWCPGRRTRRRDRAPQAAGPVRRDGRSPADGPGLPDGPGDPTRG